MTKEMMELQENRAKKQSCYKFWQSVPERISRGVEHFFYRLGVNIAQSPLKWMLGCSAIILLCILGLFRFRQEKNPVKLWVPPDADFVSDTDWLLSHYEEALRVETFILTGDNILEQKALIKLNEITKQIMNISTQTPNQNISWTNVCMKIPSISNQMYRMKRESSLTEDNFFDDDFVSKSNKTSFEPAVHLNPDLYCSIIESLPMACVVLSILDIWNFNSTEIENDSIDKIITKINTIKISRKLGHPVDFSELLGGVTLDENGWIIAATAIKTNFMVHVNFRNVDMDKMGNAAGTADWVKQHLMY